MDVNNQLFFSTFYIRSPELSGLSSPVLRNEAEELILSVIAKPDKSHLPSAYQAVPYRTRSQGHSTIYYR